MFLTATPTLWRVVEHVVLLFYCFTALTFNLSSFSRFSLPRSGLPLILDTELPHFGQSLTTEASRSRGTNPRVSKAQRNLFCLYHLCHLWINSDILDTSHPHFGHHACTMCLGILGSLRRLGCIFRFHTFLAFLACLAFHSREAGSPILDTHPETLESP